MGIQRRFGLWQETDCEECGQRFQVTRSCGKTIDGPVVCGDCKIWRKAFQEGQQERQHKTDAMILQIAGCDDMDDVRFVLQQCGYRRDGTPYRGRTEEQRIEDALARILREKSGQPTYPEADEDGQMSREEIDDHVTLSYAYLKLRENKND